MNRAVCTGASEHMLTAGEDGSVMLQVLLAVNVITRLASVSLSACSPPPRPAAFSVNVPLRSTNWAPGDSATAMPPPSCCAWLPCSGVQGCKCQQVESERHTERWPLQHNRRSGDVC